MKFNNLDEMKRVIENENTINERKVEIKQLDDEIENIQFLCPDNICICTSKEPKIFGNTVFIIETIVCIVCGKKINYRRPDCIVIDMCGYETGANNRYEDMLLKLSVARTSYLDILNNNPDITKEELEKELNIYIHGKENIEKPIEKIKK